MFQGNNPPDAPKSGDRYYNLGTQKIYEYLNDNWGEMNNADVSSDFYIKTILVNPPSALSVFSRESSEVLRIEQDGRIFWKKPGTSELLPVEVDSEIGQAFALCVETIAGLPSPTLMEKIKEDAVKEYINKKASE